MSIDTEVSSSEMHPSVSAGTQYGECKSMSIESAGHPKYGDSHSLRIRLSRELHKKVIFFVGSALTSKAKCSRAKPHCDCEEECGVPNTKGIVNLINDHIRLLRTRDSIQQDNNHLWSNQCPGKQSGSTPAMADTEIDSTADESQDGLSLEQQYKKTFEQLFLSHGPDAVRQILRDAVLEAWYDKSNKPGERRHISAAEHEEIVDDIRYIAECQQSEDELSKWCLPSGAEALGKIIAEFPESFGSYLLTTNFDPLLGIAIRRARGTAVQTVLYADGNPNLTLVNGCHLIHLHGYWHRDALHTPMQIIQKRPNLYRFLQELIRKYTIVVMGSGGWDDLFMNAVKEVLKRQNEEPDILWTFYKNRTAILYPESDKEDLAYREKIETKLAKGIARGRVSLYEGIDCHKFLPLLLKELRESNASAIVNLRSHNCCNHLDQMVSKDSAVPAVNAGDSDGNQIERQALSRLASEGAWLLFASHGARSIVKLELLPSQVDGKVIVLSGPCSNDRSVFQSKSQYPEIWELEPCNSCLTLRYKNGTYKMRIPSAFDGSIHWTIEKWFAPNKLTHDEPAGATLSKEEEKWKTAFCKYRKIVNFDPKFNFLPLMQKRVRPIIPECVAVHVLPWPQKCNLTEFTCEGVTQGLWLKIAPFGATYLVQLHRDGTLTEQHLHNRAKQTYGRWWIDKENTTEAVLNFWFGSWNLAVKSVPNRENCLFQGIEIEPIREREDKFSIAHVIPVY